jgi:hypothetical protein
MYIFQFIKDGALTIQVEKKLKFYFSCTLLFDVELVNLISYIWLYFVFENL